MNSKHLAKVCLLGLALAAPVVSIHAEAEAPAAQQANGIRFINGGITIDESTAMKRLAPQYRLRLVLASRSGAYQVAQELQLMRGDQTLLSLPDAGPWLLADLPPGPYRLVATVAGERLEKSLVVGRNATTVHWVTPAHLD